MRSSRTIYVPDRQNLPMIIRAHYAWTFLGLGLFTSANLLFGGLYLLDEAIRNPLRASGMAVIISGFLLALSAFMFDLFSLAQGQVGLRNPPLSSTPRPRCVSLPRAYHSRAPR
jgi:hypothetical protein